MMKRPKKIMAHLRECSTTFSGKPDFSSACSTKGDDLDIHFDSHFTHESVSSTRVTIEKEQNIKDGQRNSPPKSPKNFVLPHFNSFVSTPPNPKLASQLRHMSDGKNAETECTRTRKPSSVEKIVKNCHSVLGFDILLLRFKTWSQWRKVTR